MNKTAAAAETKVKKKAASLKADALVKKTAAAALVKGMKAALQKIKAPAERANRDTGLGRDGEPQREGRNAKAKRCEIGAGN